MPSAVVVCLQEDILQEVLPKSGLVVSEKGNLTEALCKVCCAYLAACPALLACLPAWSGWMLDQALT